MRKAKIILLMLLLTVVCMTGCKQKIVITTGFDDGELVKIAGKTVNLSEAMILLLSEKESYDVGLDEQFWQIEYKDKTMLSYFKTEIKEEFIRLNVLAEYANSKNIYLTEEEKQDIADKARIYMELADAEAVKTYNISQSDVESLMKKMLLSEKVYEMVVNDYVIEISEEEARVMYANYITVDADMEKAMDIAQEIYGRVSLGTDMGIIAEKYDYATYGEAYMTRGDFEEEQSEIIFRLKDGEISSVIEQNGKLYIIKCINDYDETMTTSNKSLLINEKRDEEFNKEYRPYEKSVNVEFNTNLWDSLDLNEEQKVIGVNIYDLLNEVYEIEEAEQQ